MRNLDRYHTCVQGLRLTLSSRVSRANPILRVALGYSWSFAQILNGRILCDYPQRRKRWYRSCSFLLTTEVAQIAYSSMISLIVPSEVIVGHSTAQDMFIQRTCNTQYSFWEKECLYYAKEIHILPGRWSWIYHSLLYNSFQVNPSGTYSIFQTISYFISTL